MEKDGDLRSLFKKNILSAHWTTIETSATTSGTPDLEGCLNGVQAWVELKRTDGWVVDIRPAQRGWILRRSSVGGRVWVAVRQLGTDRDNLWLVPGSAILELSTNGLKGLKSAHVWSLSPRYWDWNKVSNLLFDTP